MFLQLDVSILTDIMVEHPMQQLVACQVKRLKPRHDDWRVLKADKQPADTELVACHRLLDGQPIDWSCRHCKSPLSANQQSPTRTRECQHVHLQFEQLGHALDDCFFCDLECRSPWTIDDHRDESPQQSLLDSSRRRRQSQSSTLNEMAAA